VVMANGKIKHIGTMEELTKKELLNDFID
jgi:hypothetical protein